MKTAVVPPRPDLSGFDGDPADLIPVLQTIQSLDGFVSEESVRLVSRWLKVSENEIYGVATFFSQFRFTKPGEHVIRVCLGTACHVKGGEQIMDVFRRRLGIEPGDATPDGKYQLERVACLGCCALAPVLVVDARVHSQASVLKIQNLLGRQASGEDS
ncbi:MAG: NAD(P)H-dependent oxidoreductase subunit E [Candidatus Eisenbacteria bacterium]|nr:NAD(P)H-dependent oxidoreductase subunit E [Candidatus Eisenbacteria bacterium]